MVKFELYIQLAEICLAVRWTLVLVDSPWVHVFLVGVARFWISLCCSGLVVGLGIVVVNHSGWGWFSVDLFLIVFFFGGRGGAASPDAACA